MASSPQQQQNSIQKAAAGGGGANTIGDVFNQMNLVLPDDRHDSHQKLVDSRVNKLGAS